ncbi:MAG: hypothetical protein EPO12_14195 [Aquabacterium sp.]|jgi:hypothetical protein|nr:MAG: hypothetical protein EPO12_14195 [Aquabacterium sp.]
MPVPNHPDDRASAERERRRLERSRRAVVWGRGILMGSATVALVLAMRHVAQIPQQQRLAPAAVLVIVYLLTAWITLSGQLDDWFTGKRR